MKAVTLIVAAAVCAGGAQAQTVDQARSRIVAQFRQMNVPGEGSFGRFAAQVAYDPARIAQARAQIEIDITSFDIGFDDYNAEVMSRQWFDAKAFPKATFVTTSARPIDASRFEAAGKLTIKGRTVEVAVPVTVTADGAMLAFDGVLPIRRLQFGIGEGEWKDTSVVADEVRIRFHIAARR